MLSRRNAPALENQDWRLKADCSLTGRLKLIQAVAAYHTHAVPGRDLPVAGGRAYARGH
jgi:hypothetical protein